MEAKLTRSRSDRVIWGVAGGLGKYLDIDPIIIRVVFVLLCVTHGIGVLAYIIMAIVIPKEGTTTSQNSEIIKENVEEIKDGAAKAAENISSVFIKEDGPLLTPDKIRQRRRVFIGAVLIIIGAFLLALNFNLFGWVTWGRLWPLLILVVPGFLLVFSTRRR